MNSNPFDSLSGKVRSVDIDRRRHWYVFRAFNIYRLVLAGVLLGNYLLNGTSYFGASNPALFYWTCILYIGFVLLALLGAWRRWPSYATQATLQVVIDILVLSTMGLASGGNDVTLVSLLVIALAAGGILLSLSVALGVALGAWALLFGYKLYQAWASFAAPIDTPRLTPALIEQFGRHVFAHMDWVMLGLVGCCCAGAVLITYFLADRTRRSESTSGRELQRLLELAQLNQAVVQHLQSGIIVVDRFARIRLINHTARQLLDYNAPAKGLPLSDVSPQLSQRLATWLSITLTNPRPFRQQQHLPDVTPTFTALSDSKRADDTLILLEDSAQSAQRLQQIKMVALGRLTSSIAHEVRNPLASISHAAQLLQESPTASNGDKRLGHIIHDNAKRANVTIANVLDLSRRDKAKPEEFVLDLWLYDFRKEFLRGRGDDAPEISQQVEPEDLMVRFDANHLRQVLWNLLTNSCSHGTPEGEKTSIRLQAWLDTTPGFARPVLDVIDKGPGVSELEIERVFEPFFSTKAQGSGLGLYVSREICEANRGQLLYLHDDDQRGGRFRIIFPAISKQEKQALRTARRVAVP